MRNLILTSTFLLLTVVTFAQSKGDQPQLAVSSQKDTVANVTMQKPSLATAEENVQSPALGNSKAENENTGAPQTPQLSETTPPKKEY